MFGDVFVVNDALDAIFLILFFFGLAFTSISLLFGAFDLGGSAAGHVGHGHLGDIQAHGNTDHSTDANVFNVATLLAFSTWFGGAAYLLRNGAGLHVIISLLGGLVAGAVGGYLILRLLQWVKGKETFLDARKERLTGSIGRVTSPIRDGGVGEIVYEMNGVRQVSAARAPVGLSITRGSEVIVLRREHGISYVEPWKALEASEDWESRFVLDAKSSGEHSPP